MDQPLTLAVFEEFQRKVFEQLDGVIAVKEALALVESKLDDLDLRAGELALRFEGVENRMAGVEAAVLSVDERLSRVDTCSSNTPRSRDESPLPATQTMTLRQAP